MERELGIKNKVMIDLRLIGGHEIDAGDLDQLTRALQKELGEIPVIKEMSFALPRAACPDSKGAKGLVDTVGTLFLNLKSEGIPSLLQFLKAWVSRPGRRPVKIKAKGKSGEIEIEFDPKTLTAKKVQEMALALQSATNQ